ncbi:TPA: hypothetical protein EYO12_04375 [Candidatus Saccharibacteria bacterium]|nr:hypothetical protein [Candidatus Saccharibacteria bacterium]HIO87729.1 hypothetical protein [Candidatus Saccharibacteria bacterium]
MINKNEFFELVNRYPSPHNGQPMRLKTLDNNTYEVYFQKERGLQSTGVSLIFSFVTVGLFFEYLHQSGRALGHSVQAEVNLPEISKLKGTGLIRCGLVKIDWNTSSPDKQYKQALLFRQTSRKKYHAPLSKEAIIGIESCIPTNMSLIQLDKKQAHDAIWLNQRAVFDDMFNEPVRKELDHWLRYSKKKIIQTKDGLAYDCMELNGTLMKFITNHPSFLRMPILKTLIKQYYLRTMKDNSCVFYIMAPFKTAQDSFGVGSAIMKIWLKIAENGDYLHPFGTIISNKKAHQDFLNLVGKHNESKEESYLVFIFRAGQSKKPAQSLRKPWQEHLVINGETK